MHVLQVLGFPPDRVGGTEIYVTALASALAKLGVTSTLVAPQESGTAGLTEHAGFRVETYPVGPPSRDELKTDRPPANFSAFQDILSRHPGAIYHQHSWTRGCGPHHLRAARDAGLTTVLTMHVPANLCLRGDMMLFGVGACDGRIDPQICGACWSQDKGLPAPVARTLARIPLPISRTLRRTPGRLATALSARALAEEKQITAHQMIHDADHIVAVSDWVHRALLANGAGAGTTSMIRQGVSEGFLAQVGPQSTPRRGQTLQLLYVGSWNPLKGVDVVVRALRSTPSLKVRLTVHAPTGGPIEQAYEQSVRDLAQGDERIVFRASLTQADLPKVMATHDALVVPSVWLETGPLVVMEAQAVGLFVLGSNLGGIAENVRDGSGMLVEPGDVLAWAAALQALAQRNEAQGLSIPRSQVRTMSDVAADMASLYRRLQP